MAATDTGLGAREVDHRQRVLVDRLEADELVGVGIGGRRLAQGDHRGVDGRRGVERLVVGADADIGLAQIVPHLEPFDEVVRLEGELAVGGIERLAAGAQPVLERRIAALAAIGQEPHAVRLGVEGVGLGLVVVIAPVAGRQVHAGVLERLGVDHHGHRIGAQADRIELAVDASAFDLVLVEIAEVQPLADILVERLHRTALGVFDDIAVIHLEHVRGVAAGHLRAQLRPVVVEGVEFLVVGEARIGLGEQIAHRIGAVGAGLAAPPVEPEMHVGSLGRREPAHCAGGGERGRSHQELPAVEADCHV